MPNTNYCWAQHRGGTGGEHIFGRYVPAGHRGSHTRDRTAAHERAHSEGEKGCEEEEQPRGTRVYWPQPHSWWHWGKEKESREAELGKGRQRSSYLSLLPTAWRNIWISILIGNKFIFLKSTLSCPNNNWWFPCLYLNPEVLQPIPPLQGVSEWVTERKLDHQPRETYHNQPNLPRNTPGLSNYMILHYLCMPQSCSIFFKSYWSNIRFM